MRVERRSLRSFAGAVTLLLVSAALVLGQASYTAQVRGVVKDQSGAMIPGATVTITNDATGIAGTAHSDDHGFYILTGLRPAVYTIRTEAAGFRVAEQKNVVLQVDQQTSIDFELHPLGVITTVEVTQAAPLLDTESAAIGTDITNEYVRDIPLYNRSMFGLVFLAGGVTETTGSGINDNYPSGTNFVSNGQRNATAQVSLDGSPLSAPEQGEGGNSNVYYQPSVEIVQEFKVQNNSFSAEFGNNGGTVVNMVIEAGYKPVPRQRMVVRATFGIRCARLLQQRRPSRITCAISTDFRWAARSSKNKTFFFVDFEKIRQQDPINIEGVVPTDLERAGDFSQSSRQHARRNLRSLDVRHCEPRATSPAPGTQFQDGGVLNKIPAAKIDPIGQAILNLYPHANVAGARLSRSEFPHGHGDPTTQAGSSTSKIDHQIHAKPEIGGRYSRHHDISHSADRDWQWRLRRWHRSTRRMCRTEAWNTTGRLHRPRSGRTDSAWTGYVHPARPTIIRP